MAKTKRFTRNSYKRKIILFGIALFMSIALVSTGFAAWIMSTSATEQVGGNVSVGVVTDSSLTISNVELTEYEFSFEPLATDSTGRVRYDGKNSEVLSATVTGQVGPVEFLGELRLMLVVPEGVKKAADLGYIVLPECATTSTETGGILLSVPQNSEGNYVFTSTITFDWGEVFGYQNPGEYYDIDVTGKGVSDEEVRKTLEDFRAIVYGYYDEFVEGQSSAERLAVIDAHKNDSLPLFQVVVVAIAN